MKVQLNTIVATESVQLVGSAATFISTRYTRDSLKI